MDTETQPTVNTTLLRAVRNPGIVEGTSTLVLFGIAMPLKYMANMPEAVQIVGRLHGFLFVAFAVLLMVSISRIPISRFAAWLGIAAAVIPFGPFIYDKRLLRHVADRHAHDGHAHDGAENNTDTDTE